MDNYIEHAHIWETTGEEGTGCGGYISKALCKGCGYQRITEVKIIPAAGWPEAKAPESEGATSVAGPS
jgi:hypothetical protein